MSERELAVVTRESELEAPEAAAVLPAAAEPTPEPSPDELARIEAKLAELHEAEKQFARTHAELAARSDALAEREAGLALREQSLSSRETSPAPELGELEARIRRLERSQSSTGTTQTFSSGLRRSSSAASAAASRRTSLYTDPTWGVSSVGRAPALQAGGRRFEPGTLHLTKAPLKRGFRLQRRKRSGRAW